MVDMKALGGILDGSVHWGGEFLKIAGAAVLGNEIVEKYRRARKASLPKGALNEYRLILAAHAAAFADPSNGLGGGVAVDLAYRTWAEKFKVTGKLRGQLKPEESFVKLETAKDSVRRTFYDVLPGHSPDNAPSGIRDLIAIKNQITEEVEQLVGSSSSLSGKDLHAKQQEIKKLRESFDTLYETEQLRGTIAEYLQQRTPTGERVEANNIMLDRTRMQADLKRMGPAIPKGGI